MEVIHTSEVDDFIDLQQLSTQKAVRESIDLLKHYGFRLSMPDAKPVGSNIWELRVRVRPAVRILYGFCNGVPILLVAFTKQKSAIPRKVFERARRILRDLCNY